MFCLASRLVVASGIPVKSYKRSTQAFRTFIGVETAVLKPGLHLVVAVAEHVCDDAPKGILSSHHIDIDCKHFLSKINSCGNCNGYQDKIPPPPPSPKEKILTFMQVHWFVQPYISDLFKSHQHAIGIKTAFFKSHQLTIGYADHALFRQKCPIH